MTELTVELSSNAPTGWLLRGDNLDGYSTGVDSAVVHSGQFSGYLKSRSTNSAGFGTLMQGFQATAYRNQRLCLSAYIKSVDVQAEAALWMRIDDATTKILAFDNKHDRPITGSVDWTRYTIVLQVPEASAIICFGVLLAGAGKVWIDDVQFTVVDQGTPVTGRDLGDDAEYSEATRAFSRTPAELRL